MAKKRLSQELGQGGRDHWCHVLLRWRQEYGGLKADQAKKLNDLERAKGLEEAETPGQPLGERLLRELQGHAQGRAAQRLDPLQEDRQLRRSRWYCDSISWRFFPCYDPLICHPLRYTLDPRPTFRHKLLHNLLTQVKPRSNKCALNPLSTNLQIGPLPALWWPHVSVTFAGGKTS